MQNQNTQSNEVTQITISEWINPAKILRIKGHTITFGDYTEFESITAAISNDLSKILESQQPDFKKANRPTIKIGRESYNFNTYLSSWYCSNSPSWYRRNMICYVALNSKLSIITSAAGFNRIPTISKLKKILKSKSKNNG
jgi:hypothetical protein